MRVLFSFLERNVLPRVARISMTGCILGIDRMTDHDWNYENIVDRQDAQVQEGSVAVALPGSWLGYIGVSRHSI